MPKNRDQGIGLNGTAKIEIFAVFMLGLYTILPSLMFNPYGAWHTRGRSRGDHALRDIVCGQNTGGRNKEARSGLIIELTSAQSQNKQTNIL